MGRDVPALVFTREDRRRYRDKMHTCLDVLAQMLRESGFESERPQVGLEIPDPQPPAPPAPQLPDRPAYQQIMAVFATADAPLRARQVCEALDMEIAPNNINNTRLKLKRQSPWTGLG
ncbi:hypothetical protein ABZT04_22240 [Streptomyces sp. NPDC005492]|uniref:hypothetical protein n=1 Tax=Streptomyces sp. NPDC005492 TaxID=3156883 RepID=UPI0033BDAB6C